MATQIGLRFISVKYGRRVGGGWGGWGGGVSSNKSQTYKETSRDKKAHIIQNHVKFY